MVNGQQNCKSTLSHKLPLDQDDFLQITLNLTIGVQTEQPPNNSTNAFFIQLSPAQANDEQALGSDFVSMYGLVIAVMGTNNRDNGTYIVSFRFFSQETVLNKDYFSLLSDSRDKLEGCLLPNLNEIKQLVIRIDFEKTHRLEVFLHDNEKLKPCLAVDSPMRYMTAKQTLMSFKVMTGVQNPLGLTITGLQVHEKQHSLDIEQELTISRDLVEEIFDKVASFTEKFNADKAKLQSIYELQQNLAADSSKLEMYAADLFKGTRKFQEYMLENLSSHKIMSPANMPKMQKIKNKIDELKMTQKTIFDRFLAIQAILDSRKLLKRSYKKLLALQQTMTRIQELVNDPSFDQLINDSKQILQTASSSNIDSIIKTFSEMKEVIDHKATLGIGASLTFGGLLILIIFAWLIMKKISAVEKSHFS